MCDTVKEMEESKEIFMKAKTVVEFMEIWSRFYENKICIPTYYSKFIGGPDNPQANIQLGHKLKEIAIRGFLAIDSQVGIPNEQKGYLIGFLPNTMVEMVVDNLNRYSGIISFYSNIKNFNGEVCENLYVTYDPTEAISSDANKMPGTPYTQIGRPDSDSFETIREWMSEKVKRKIKAKKYKYVVILAPCFDSPSEFVFDKLLEVLRCI